LALLMSNLKVGLGPLSCTSAPSSMVINLSLSFFSLRICFYLVTPFDLALFFMILSKWKSNSC
jgi:hypothetical protein